MSNLQHKLKVAIERDSNAVLVRQYGKKELPLRVCSVSVQWMMMMLSKG
jgi:hypothetical protein